jgi:hypothetical protein
VQNAYNIAHFLVKELPNKEYGNMDPADLDNYPMVTVS